MNRFLAAFLPSITTLGAANIDVTEEFQHINWTADNTYN